MFRYFHYYQIRIVENRLRYEDIMFDVKLNITPFIPSEKQEGRKQASEVGFNGVARVYSFGNFARGNTLRRFRCRAVRSYSVLQMPQLGILTRTPSP